MLNQTSLRYRITENYPKREQNIVKITSFLEYFTLDRPDGRFASYFFCRLHLKDGQTSELHNIELSFDRPHGPVHQPFFCRLNLEDG